MRSAPAHRFALVVASVLIARPAFADPAPAPGPLATRAAALEPEAASDDQARAFRFLAGVTLTGVGFFGLVLGSALGIRAIVDKSQIGAHCDRAARCDPTGYTLGMEARGSAVISTVSFAIGVGATAGGIGLLVSGTPKKAGTAVWLSPAPAGLVAGARW